MVFNRYQFGEDNLLDYFHQMLNSPYVQDTLKEPFRILIYNGDVDVLCDFVMAELFVNDMVKENGADVIKAQLWYANNLF